MFGRPPYFHISTTTQYSEHLPQMMSKSIEYNNKTSLRTVNALPAQIKNGMSKHPAFLNISIQ
jgi:hypothetical protein